MNEGQNFADIDIDKRSTHWAEHFLEPFYRKIYFLNLLLEKGIGRNKKSQYRCRVVIETIRHDRF